MNYQDTRRTKTRILLVDDHTIFRQGLATLLRAEPDFEMLPHCGSVAEALLLLETELADVLLLDLDLGGQRGTDLLDAARRKDFGGAVIVLTADTSAEQEAALLKQGVSCVLRKDISTDILSRTIRQVMGSWKLGIAPELANAPPPSPHGRSGAFTRRESEVLRRLIEGSGNKEIAAELQCSEAAVKGIVQQLFHKTGANTRSQLVRLALERYRVSS